METKDDAAGEEPRRITVCIGSSCHLKGARRVVELLELYIAEANLGDRVALSGAFCMGNCVNGVSVRVDGRLVSLKPEGVRGFFDTEFSGEARRA
jgi:NADH:ubiquinone oxidoreductase subunit E